jgi:hypothetical protein
MRDDLEGMRPEEPIEWYMARDGQQYGRLSDAEMKKFHELGHLQASDRLWRKGFADWRPAGEVFDIAPRGTTKP